MPSLLPTYTTREEHVKNQRADLMYRIITNKNKSPPKPKSSSKSSPKTPTKTPTKSPSKTPTKSPTKTATKTPTKNPNKFKGVLPKISIRDLPDDIIRKFTLINYKSLLKYKLYEWIPRHKLKLEFVSLNPNAIDFLSLPQNKKYINYSKLCENTNPRAMELIAEEINLRPNNPDIHWRALSKNKYAIDILDKHRDKIRMSFFSGNTNPRAIKIIEEIRLATGNDNSSSGGGIDWEEMSANTSTVAIDFLKLPENYNKIEWHIFSANTNPKAIEMLIQKESEEFDLEEREFKRLKNYEKINWTELSKNPKAISLLEKKWEDEKGLKRNDRREYNKLKKIGYIIDWTSLSVNVNAIDLIRRKIDEENKLSEKAYDSLEPIEKINWWVLSRNPEAIHLLEANRDKIDWVQLGKNPKAIKLLEEELKVRPQNIYWYSLSGNPEAIKILNKNKDKIVWSIFSENPNAGELLRERIEFEEKLPKKKYNEITNYNKLNWYFLSSNPSIFTY
jgi:hypothetical protein